MFERICALIFALSITTWGVLAMQAGKPAQFIGGFPFFFFGLCIILFLIVEQIVNVKKVKDDE